MPIRNYCYGPVPSRRLGFSLGVDLFPRKTCSFNCLYCQLGTSSKRTARRSSFVNRGKFRRELSEIIKKKPKIDYITISGSGEPTLHKDLDQIIATIRKVTKHKYPIAVITNSSLLYRRKVRQELAKADLIIPSLDAATAKTFAKINYPCKGVSFKRIVAGLIQLRKEFKGKIWLEIMLVAGVNDCTKEIKKFKSIIDKINPDKLQLNLPVRPGRTKVSSPSQEKVAKIGKIFAGKKEAAVKFSYRKLKNKICSDLGLNILNFLRVRPGSLKDLAISQAVSPKQISKQLSLLLKQKLISEHRVGKIKYFIIND
ncbi:MAG: radical SAM protein [Candidatus Omnitrophota bacterium]